MRIDELATGAGPRYGGFWVDGGVLNNLPIHAFDEKADNPKRSSTPGLSGLHPNVLGLRLTPGFPPTFELKPGFPDPLQQSMFAVLSVPITWAPVLRAIYGMSSERLGWVWVRKMKSYLVTRITQ